MNNDVILGRLMGRREAFSFIAGHCSAAEAEQLRRIRDGKLYLGHAKDWDEFCTVFLHISRASAAASVNFALRIVVPIAAQT